MYKEDHEEWFLVLFVQLPQSLSHCHPWMYAQDRQQMSTCVIEHEGDGQRVLQCSSYQHTDPVSVCCGNAVVGDSEAATMKSM